MNKTEWRKFIDYFGLSIEADPYKVGKKNINCFRIGSIPSTSSGNPHISMQKLDKQLNLEQQTLQLHQLIKKLASKIAPHIYSSLRDLGVIFD